MSRHILVKEIDTDYAARFPDYEVEYRYRIECPLGNGCSGWVECWEPHEVDGKSADGDPWDVVGTDEFTFHGVVHTWHDGWGWTVPYVGCIVQFGDWEVPDNMRMDLPVGRYVVEDDWDDDLVMLDYIGPEPVAAGAAAS